MAGAVTTSLSQMLQAVGYYGPAAPAPAAFARLSAGLDEAIVRIVTARPSLEPVSEAPAALTPSLIRGREAERGDRELAGGSHPRSVRPKDRGADRYLELFLGSGPPWRRTSKPWLIQGNRPNQRTRLTYRPGRGVGDGDG
jgi:hypothetical protein